MKPRRIAQLLQPPDGENAISRIDGDFEPQSGSIRIWSPRKALETVIRPARRFVRRLPNGASEVPSDFIARIEPTVKNTACTNPETKILFENGVSLHYSYKGKSGTFIGDFVLTPAECGL